MRHVAITRETDKCTEYTDEITSAAELPRVSRQANVQKSGSLHNTLVAGSSISDLYVWPGSVGQSTLCK